MQKFRLLLLLLLLLLLFAQNTDCGYNKEQLM